MTSPNHEAAENDSSISTDEVRNRSSRFRVVEPYIPSEEVNWEAKLLQQRTTTTTSSSRPNLVGGNEDSCKMKQMIIDGSGRSVVQSDNDAAAGVEVIATSSVHHHFSSDSSPILFEATLWHYVDPEVESEFERFFFRDQTNLSVGIVYFLAPLFAAVRRTAARPELLEPPHIWWPIYTTVVPLLCLFFTVVDQVFFLKESLKNHPYRTTVRQAVSIVLALVVVSIGGWYDPIFQANCSLYKFPAESTHTVERHCTENFIYSTLVTFANLPMALRLKLHHCFFLCVFNYASGLISMAILGGNYFTFGARHAVTMIIMHTIFFLGFSTLAAFRFLSIRRQFEAAISVIVAQRRLKSRQAVVETLLESLVPKTVLPRLMDAVVFRSGSDRQVDATTSNLSLVVDTMPRATVLLSDIVNFTKWSSKRSAGEVVKMLNFLVGEFDHAAQEMSVERVKTIGDAYWAVCGLPEYLPDHADRMCRFGKMMQIIVARANSSHPEWSALASDGGGAGGAGGGVQIRIGIHSGELSGAILGSQQVAYEVFGETNEICHQVEQSGITGHVTVTESVLEACSFGVPACLATFPGAGGSKYRVVNLRDSSGSGSGGTSSVKLFVLAEDRGEDTASGTTRSEISRVSSAGALVKLAAKKKEQGVAETRRREKFLLALKTKERSAGTSAHNDDEDLDALGAREQLENRWKAYEQRLIERKFSCCCTGLADQEAEEKYEDYIRRNSWSFRQAARVFQVVFNLSLIVVYLIDGRDLKLGTLLLWTCGLGLSILPVALNGEYYYYQLLLQSKALPKPQVVDFVLCIIWTLVLLVGAMIGALPKTTESINIAVNSSFSIFFVPCWTVVFTTGLGLPLGALSTLAVFIPTVMIPFLAISLISDPVSFTDSAIIALFACCGCSFFAFIAEKVYRQGFLDEERAKHFSQQALEQVRLSEDVLQKLVPKFIIPRLTAWISSGLDPTQAIAQNYSQLCVAFVTLLPPPTAAPNGGEEHDDDDDEQLDKRPSSSSWLLEAHMAIDEYLHRAEKEGGGIDDDNPMTRDYYRTHCHDYYSSSLKKIKSIGETVMVAGPFSSEYRTTEDSSDDDDDVKLLSTVDLQTAVQETLLLARWISNELGLSCVGVHVGPVMAAVLGTVRPMFDVFGDTVNTASRVQSVSSSISSSFELGMTEDKNSSRDDSSASPNSTTCRSWVAYSTEAVALLDEAHQRKVRQKVLPPISDHNNCCCTTVVDNNGDSFENNATTEGLKAKERETRTLFGVQFEPECTIQVKGKESITLRRAELN